MDLRMFICVTAILMLSEGLIVKGPSGPLVVPLGASVLLPCSVDSLSSMEDLEVQWRRSDSETLVHLFQDGDVRPEVQQQEYHDRAHFFTENIKHGNFSLLLENVRAEDEGEYTCKVYSGQDSVKIVVEVKCERLIVSGSNGSISAYEGEDVTLSCSVDSRIPPEEIEEVSWKKTDKDGDLLVLLYQDNEAQPESSDERYRGRVEFFTDEIHRGNFSLRLKRVRTEDKGVYMCKVFAGELSANTTVVLEQLGFSALHIMVLILCITACGSALLICCLIYCRPNTGFIVEGSYGPVSLGGSAVLPCFIDPHLLKNNLKVEWRRSDSQSSVCVYPEVQKQEYHDRAHFFTEDIKHGNFSLLLENVRAEDEGEYTCKVYSGWRCVFSVRVTLTYDYDSDSDSESVSGFFVEYSCDLVVPLGASVILPYYKHKHEPEEDLEVQWRRSDSETLVHLFQDGDVRPEVQQQEYHDRAHFFTEDIKHGNFSLLLEKVRAEDEGEYTCKVYSGQDSAETVAEIKDVERLKVSGSNSFISVYVGEDVTLSCSVDSHIPPEEIEEVSWKKTDKDGDLLVLRYKNNEVLSESSHERYRDRVEFFTDEIHRGNFSLRLKSVRTEDKGVYMCLVFAGGLSANTTVILERLGFSALHIMVLILCITACGAAVIICCLIYCRPEITDTTAAKPVKTLGYFHVFLPNIIMFVAFVLWGVTEGFLYETIFCCALCLLRPLMLIYVAPYLKNISGATVVTEFSILTVVYFSVIFRHAWGTVVLFAVFEKAVVMVAFGLVLLICAISFISWCGEDLRGVAAFIFFFLPSLQFTFLFLAFGAADRAGFFVTVLFPVLFFLIFSCLDDIEGGKKGCINLLNITTWISFMFIMNAVIGYMIVTSLENEKDAAGWTCTAVFLQVLWMNTLCIDMVSNQDPPYKKILYVFGSVGVVLLNAVALMTELILKTVNGDRAVGDLRIVVYPSESLFTFIVMILFMFDPWINRTGITNCLRCSQNVQRSADTPANTQQQNEEPRNAEEAYELESLCTEDLQEENHSGTDSVVSQTKDILYEDV